MTANAGELSHARRALASDLRIRSALADDAWNLSEVFVAAWHDGYSAILAPELLEALEVRATADRLAPLLADELTTTSVIETTDGSLVAFCRYGEDPDEPGTGHIFSLYVAPTAKGQGLAQALIDEALVALSAAGYSRVSLWVFAGNERAQRLYCRFGFVADGTERVEEAYRAEEIRMVLSSEAAAAAAEAASVAPAPVPQSSTTERLAEDPALQPLGNYLARLAADGFPPSVSLAVVGRQGVMLEYFAGNACVVGEIVPTTIATRYDLASLTKLVCSVTLVLIAEQRGELTLDDPVQRFLPGFPGDTTTLWHLVTHTAGLIDHRPFFETLRGRQAIEAAVYAEAVTAVAGSTVRYSDLSFMLLGWVLEHWGGAGLDELFDAEVARPLGLESTGFRPQVDRHQIAATELDGDQRHSLGLVWGEVHDGNAFALGGVAGHAGLFAPLGDLARYVMHLLDPGDASVLRPASLAKMASRQAGEGADIRAIGWRLFPSQWGQWPPDTIWHTGFTGTSLLLAPSLGIGVVLLTNAVHPSRRLEDQAAMRATIHRLLAEAFA